MKTDKNIKISKFVERRVKICEFVDIKGKHLKELQYSCSNTTLKFHRSDTISTFWTHIMFSFINVYLLTN